MSADEHADQEQRPRRGLRWREMDYWDKWWRIIATFLIVAGVAGCVLLGFMAYNAYERGEQKREAENNTKIEREIIMQDALRQYREGR